MKDQEVRTDGRPSQGLVRARQAFLILVFMAASTWARGPSPVHGQAFHTPLAEWPSAISETRRLITAQAAQVVPTAASHIEIKDYTFIPATLKVAPGTTVTWTSRDDEPHTVTSRENLFTSPGLDADESFSFTFTAPGTYTYFCKLHPQMTGTIIVE